VSYFRPQNARKIAPRSVCSLPNSTQKVSQKGGRVKALDENGTPSVNPWVQTWPDQYPGLIAAVPGKATLAYVTATLILSELELPHDQGSAVENERKTKINGGDEEILMHHSDAFDGKLHEVEEKLNRT
jgi:hypothetical protein